MQKQLFNFNIDFYLDVVVVYEEEILKYEPLKHFRDKPDMPIYSSSNPKLNELFGLCFFGKNISEILCQQRPYHVRENSTFILNQEKIHIAHPYDLDADDSIGPSIKKEYVRFYEVTKREEDSAITISKEIKTEKSNTGDVIGGLVNVRDGSNSWYFRQASVDKIYAVIRRRAEDKMWKEKNVKYIRWITFIMPLEEYNKVNRTLKNKKNYDLQHNTIVVHYNVNDGEPTNLDINASHGNSKKGDNAYRPTMHSVKHKCKEIIASNDRPARFIIDEFDKEEDVITRPTDSVVPRNSRQIYNMKAAQKKSFKVEDDIFTCLSSLLDLPEDGKHCRSPIEPEQPILREFNLEAGNSFTVK